MGKRTGRRGFVFYNPHLTLRYENLTEIDEEYYGKDKKITSGNRYIERKL